MSGRRRKGHAEEHHVDERWLVSYADMITVLMALFIVLYALSTVDQKKYDELKNSLATGFGVTKSEKVDENKGPVRPEDVAKNGAGFSNSTIALQQVAKDIQDELKTSGLDSKVTVTAGTNAITISLVGSSTYFGGNDADLTRNALRVLKKLSPTLHDHAGETTIEGHANPGGSAGRWGDDWNLASARANSVREYLTDHDAIDPANVSIISWGSEHAKAGDSDAVVEHNRRVDIVLHTVTIPPTVTDPDTGEAVKEDTSKTATVESASKTEHASKTETAAKTEPEAAASH